MIDTMTACFKDEFHIGDCPFFVDQCLSIARVLEERVGGISILFRMERVPWEPSSKFPQAEIAWRNEVFVELNAASDWFRQDKHLLLILDRSHTTQYNGIRGSTEEEANQVVRHLLRRHAERIIRQQGDRIQLAKALIQRLPE